MGVFDGCVAIWTGCIALRITFCQNWMLSNIIYFSCLFIQDSIWLDVCACVRAGAHSLKRSIYVWVWSKKQQKQPGLLVECTNTEYSSILCTLNQMYCVYCTESCVYELHIHKHVRRSVCACMLQREKHGIPIVFEGSSVWKIFGASFFFSPPFFCVYMFRFYCFEF